MEKIGIKPQLFDESNNKTYHYGWSDLPYDLLQKIGKQLSTKVDVSRFRGVCHSWRLCVPPFKNQQLFPSFPFVIDDAGIFATTKIFTVSADLFVYQFVSPTHDDYNQSQFGKNWLMLVKEGTLSRALYPSRLMQKYELKKPNFLDFRVFEVARSYRVHSSYGNIGSNSKVAISLMNADRPELMILNKKNDREAGNLYHCRLCSLGSDDHPKENNVEAGLHNWNLLGSDDQPKVLMNRWTKLTCVPVTDSDNFVDIIFHRGKFYAIADNGEAIVVDSSSSPLKPVTIVKPPLSDGVYGRLMNIIESSRELLLVETPSFYGHPVKVFKLNTDEKRWVKIEHLKGRVLFVVGFICCFSVSTRKFPGLMHDCIYYYDSGSNSISPRVFDLLTNRYIFFSI